MAWLIRRKPCSFEEMGILGWHCGVSAELVGLDEGVATYLMGLSLRSTKCVGQSS